jgi:hypothetical protein
LVNGEATVDDAEPSRRARVAQVLSISLELKRELSLQSMIDDHDGRQFRRGGTAL